MMNLRVLWNGTAIVWFLLLTPCPLQAQMQAVQTGGGPRLVGKHIGQETPVKLTKLEVEAKVSGLLAETTLICTFQNDHNIIMEGEFLMPLPDSATVSGYALDVDGRMIDGVIVEKNKARFVFEREKRKQVDPGTVEWVDGNLFRTRVYPIPPKGSRTVRISYVHPLYAFDGRLHYRFPFEGYPLLNELKLNLSFEALPATPLLARDPFGGLRLKNTETGFDLTQTFRRRKPKNELVVSCAYPDRDLVDITQLENNEYAFLAAVRVDQRAVKRSGWQQEKMALYWDGSASLTSEGRTRATAFLKQFLNRYRGVQQLDLIVFRDEQEQPVRFQRQAGVFAALFAYLEKIPADGGTNLYGLVPLADADFAMLVSDGRDVTHGVGWPSFDMPVFAVQPEPLGTDHILRSLARESSGDYLNLSNTKTKAAVDQVGRSLPILLKADAPDARLIEAFTTREHTLADRLWVCGRFKGAAPFTLGLDFGLGTERGTRYQLDMDPVEATSPLAARFWAQSKLRQLLARPDHYHEAILNLARRYNLVTPSTTLMVLETFAQYVEYRVPPPESLSTWRARYFERVDEAVEAKTAIAQYRQNLMSTLKKVPEFLVDVPPPAELAFRRFKNRSRWAGMLTSQFKTYPHLGVITGDGSILETLEGPKPLVEGLLLTPDRRLLKDYKVHLVGSDKNGVARRFEAETDEKGRFRFDTVVAGTYQIQTQGEEIAPYTSAPFVLEGNRQVRFFQRLKTLSPQDGAHHSAAHWHPIDIAERSGVVVDQTGEPLPGATILLELAGGGGTKIAITDASGRFSFHNVPPGRHRIQVSMEGHSMGELIPRSDREEGPGYQVTMVEVPFEEILRVSERVVSDQSEVHRFSEPLDITLVEEGETAQLAYAYSSREGSRIAAAAGARRAPSMMVHTWDESVPYLQDLAGAEPELRYARYLALRGRHGRSPAFYLDVARFFFKHDQPLLARRILTNILEMGIDDPGLNRVTAFVLTEFGQIDAALNLYDKLAGQRPEWPQVRRERGLLLAQLARRALTEKNREAARNLYSEALHNVGDALWRPWGELPDDLAGKYLSDRLFGNFHQVAGIDYRRLLQEVTHHFGASQAAALAFPPLNTMTPKAIEGDLMVSLVWDDTTSDMDLWVVDPTEEPCYYSHRETEMGGRMSDDLTQGMGPEAFYLSKAVPGTYHVLVYYFGGQNRELAGPSTCMVTVVTDFGRPEETRHRHIIRLEEKKAGKHIVTFTLPE